MTNHDVKAVEYFLKEKFDLLGLEPYKEFIHFGLTSQDINNTSVPMSLKEALDEVVVPAIESLTDTLESLADQWADIPMLAKTHGQPASPTRLGKEVRVFAYRLRRQDSDAEGSAGVGQIRRRHRQFQRPPYGLSVDRLAQLRGIVSQ